MIELLFPEKFLFRQDYDGWVFVSFKTIEKKRTVRSTLSSLPRMLQIAPQKLDDGNMEEFQIFRRPPPADDLLPISLRMWHNSLLLLYISPQPGQLAYIDPNRWGVSDISAFKGGVGVHDGLIITLRHRPSNDRISDVGIRIERRKGSNCATSSPASSHTISSGIRHAISSSAQLLSGNRKYAFDTVSATGLLKKAEHIVQKHSFPNYRISLPQLVLIADIVSNHDDCHLLTSNCYWYSEMVIAMVHACIHRMDNPGAAASQSSTTTDGENDGENRVIIVEESSITANNHRRVEKGKFCGRKVLQSDETIQNIVQSKMQLYEESWQAFKNRIQRAIAPDVTQNSLYQDLLKKYEAKENMERMENEHSVLVPSERN